MPTIKELIEVIVNSTPRLAAATYGRTWPSHPHHQHTELGDDDHPQYVPRTAGPDRSFTGNPYLEEDIRLIGKTALTLDDSYRATHSVGGDWDYAGIDLSRAPGEWQALYDAVGGVTSLIDILTIAVQSGSDYWARDAGNGVLYPITATDTLKVGNGTKALPSLAFASAASTGFYFDTTNTSIRTSLADYDSFRFDRVDDVHMFRVGADTGDSSTHQYATIDWEDRNYDDRSVLEIKNYKGSAVTYNDAELKVLCHCYKGNFASTYIQSLGPNYAYITLQSSAANYTYIHLDATAGATTSEVKHSADRIVFNGQAQGTASNDPNEPDYSWYGYNDTGMRYNTPDYSIRWSLSGDDSLGIKKSGPQTVYLETYPDSTYRDFTILHSLAIGSNAPKLNLTCQGSDPAFGAELHVTAITDYESGTPARLYMGSSGGYAQTYLDSYAHGDHHDASTSVRSQADEASAVTDVCAICYADSMGYYSSLRLYARADGTDPSNDAYVRVYPQIMGNGEGHVYIGTSGTYHTDYLYFADINRTGASPAWTSPGVLLSQSATGWDNYKTQFGEVGLMEAIYAAANGGIGGGLDDAYDFGGAGAGRKITVDSSYVWFQGSASATGQIFQIENLNSANTSEVFHIYNNATLSTGKEIFFTGGNGGTATSYDEWGHQIWTGGSLTIGHGVGAGDTVRRSFTSYQYNNEGATEWAKALMMAEADTAYFQYAYVEVKAGLYGAVSAQVNLYSTDKISIEADNALTIESASGNIYIESGTASRVDITGTSDIWFDDGNRSGSSWSQGYVPLSDATAGWTDYETAHGEVGLMEAIAHGGFVGREVASGSADSQSSTTSGSYQQKLRVTTPSLTSGVGYLIFWSCELQADADVETQMHIDFNDSGPPYIAEGYYDNDPYATRGTCQSGIYYSESLSGVYNIDMDYRRSYAPGGMGSAYISRARIVVIRVT